MKQALVVIGTGPVACEMSQALHALGAQETTVLVRGDRLLARAEPFAGDLVAQSFRESGIDLRFGRSAARVERPVPDGPVTVHTDDGSQIDADEILVGAGRRPAVDEARVCGDVIAVRANGAPDDAPGLRDTADDRGAPQVVFTEPQVSMVGRTESRARADGVTVRTVEYDIGKVAGAMVRGVGYTGRAKLVVDAGRRVLLGATFVASDVADLLHSATIAVNAEVPLDRLWHAVPPFPTVSEVWLRLLEQYGL